jgi:hypothetical protein
LLEERVFQDAPCCHCERSSSETSARGSRTRSKREVLG